MRIVLCIREFLFSRMKKSVLTLGMSSVTCQVLRIFFLFLGGGRGVSVKFIIFFFFFFFGGGGGGYGWNTRGML